MSFIKKTWSNLVEKLKPYIEKTGRIIIVYIGMMVIFIIVSGGIIWWRLSALTDEPLVLPPIDEPQVSNPISNIKPDIVITQEVTEDVTQEQINEEPEIIAVNFPDPEWSWPVNNEVIKEFGVVYWPTLNDWRMHEGVDILVANQKAIKAAAYGRVKAIEYDVKFGNVITIEHGNNYLSIYAGEGDVMVKVGDEIERNQEIMIILKSGLLESGIDPHLHFVIKQNGEFVNPTNLLTPLS